MTQVNYDTVEMRIILYTVGFILFLVVGNIVAASSRRKKEKLRSFDTLNEKYVLKALDTNSLNNAREYKKILEDARKDTDIPASSEWGYRDDMSLVDSAVKGLEFDDWERRAEKHLQAFIDCYEMLIGGDFQNFKDVEEFFRVKKRCISEWQKYFAVDVSEYSAKIYPKKYMREWLGERYDPCMESHEALEKKLSEYVSAMRPEQKRKNKLYNTMAELVSDSGTLARSELLKHEFPGFIAEEVRCCYRQLLKQDRLVETKIGSRWFVSLSDKELAKKNRKPGSKIMTPDEFAQLIEK